MFYKLRTSKNIIEKVHSAICAEEREVGNKNKKTETKRRNNLESKILNKFKKMPKIGTLDPIVVRKQYKNIYLDMKKLDQMNRDFPIQYKQKLSKYQVELVEHKADLDLFTNMMRKS